MLARLLELKQDVHEVSNSALLSLDSASDVARARTCLPPIRDCLSRRVPASVRQCLLCFPGPTGLLLRHSVKMARTYWHEIW